MGVVGTMTAARQWGFFRAMLLVHWRWRVGGRWHCHSIGAGALVSEGRDLTINLKGERRGEGGGGRGEGNAQHDKQHVEGAVAF